MKKEINETELSILSRMKKCLLLDGRGIFGISKYETITETVTKKKLFGKEYTEEVIYLTHYRIDCYSRKENFWGMIEDETALRFYPIYCLPTAREFYLTMKDSLNAFGFDIYPKKVSDVVGDKITNDNSVINENSESNQ